MSEPKTCEACGREFRRPYGRSIKAWARARFCTPLCASASRTVVVGGLGLVNRTAFRDAAGCVVSLLGPDGERRAIASRGGSASEALRAVCADVPAGEGWEVVAISTPQSVYTDLHGGPIVRAFGRRFASRDPYRHERRLLAAAGRPDLCPVATKRVGK